MPRRPVRLPPYTYEEKLPSGNWRIMFRKPGMRKRRIHGVAWTPSFMGQYESLLNASAPAPAPQLDSKATPGTWKWLCIRYMASKGFKALTGTTPATRRRILEWTWEQPTEKRPDLLIGDMPVAKMDAEVFYVLRDRKAETRAAANILLKVCSYVFRFGLERHRSVVRTNPVRDVNRFSYESDGWHTWTLDELLQFMDCYPPGSKERLAMALMLFTGARGCDARKFGPQMIRDGWLGFHQQKLAKNPRGWIDLPVHEELARELELAPKSDLAFILTPYRKTYSQKGFGNWFNERCREAGLEGCTAHGLRKAAATIAADNGASVQQLMAMFGWLTEQQAIHYTKEANRKKLAAEANPLIRLPSRKKLESELPHVSPRIAPRDKISGKNNRLETGWRSHGESNPGFSLERAAS